MLLKAFKGFNWVEGYNIFHLVLLIELQWRFDDSQTPTEIILHMRVWFLPLWYCGTYCVGNTTKRLWGYGFTSCYYFAADWLLIHCKVECKLLWSATFSSFHFIAFCVFCEWCSSSLYGFLMLNLILACAHTQWPMFGLLNLYGYFTRTLHTSVS